MVRFVPKSNPSSILIGQPVQEDLDVGVAVRNSYDVHVYVFSGHSILTPGKGTGKVEVIGRILSPLAENEVGTIRCIGLNVGLRLCNPRAELVAKDLSSVQAACRGS